MEETLDVKNVILEAITFLDRLARKADNADEVTKYYSAMEKLYAEYNRAVEIDNQAYFDNRKDEKEEIRIQEEMRKSVETREIERQRNKIEMAKVGLKVFEILAAVVGLPCLVLFQLKCQQLGALPPRFLDTIVNRAIGYLSL